jgi:hypothetical protein
VTTEPAPELLESLPELIVLLTCHGEDRSEQWFRTDVASFERGDGDGLEYLLSACGGMGPGRRTGERLRNQTTAGYQIHGCWEVPNV